MWTPHESSSRTVEEVKESPISAISYESFPGVHGICWSVPGTAIDEAVAAHLLEAITESNLDMSLAVLQELEQSAQEAEHQWQLRLERVRYEAERAARQFDAAEPENRLVVRTLERRWNEKLQQLAELEQAYAEARQVQRLELSLFTAPTNSALSQRHPRYLAFADYHPARTQRYIGTAD